MAGDLEDFLRRAAERRQAKAAQQQAATRRPASRARPQYTDSRTERLARSVEAEEISADDLLDDDPDSIATRMRRVEEAKRAAAKAEAEIAERLKSKSGQKSAAPSPALTGHLAQDLIRMLRTPGGVQQAILLREVLERPEHRW